MTQAGIFTTTTKLGSKLAAAVARVLSKVLGPRVVILPVVDMELGRHHLWWGDADVLGQKATGVFSDFCLVNSTFTILHFVEARLYVWLRTDLGIRRRRKFVGQLLVNVPGTHIVTTDGVMPGSTTTGRAMWIARPRFTKAGQGFWGRACFIDSLGKKHWTPKLRFHDARNPR